MEKYNLLHIFSALCYFGFLSIFSAYSSVQDFDFHYISSQFPQISARIAPMESGKKGSSKITIKCLAKLHGLWGLQADTCVPSAYKVIFCLFNMMKYLEHPSPQFFAFFLINSQYFLICFTNLISFQQFSLWVRWNGAHRTESVQFKIQLHRNVFNVILCCDLYTFKKVKH